MGWRTVGGIRYRAGNAWRWRSSGGYELDLCFVGPRPAGRSFGPEAYEAMSGRGEAQPEGRSLDVIA